MNIRTPEDQGWAEQKATSKVEVKDIMLVVGGKLCWLPKRIDVTYSNDKPAHARVTFEHNDNVIEGEMKFFRSSDPSKPDG